MAKKKRVTRKQLLKEPDEFLTFSAKALQFAAENRKTIGRALIGLLVVVLAVALVRYFMGLSERRGYLVFEEGLSHYEAQISGEKSAAVLEIAKERFAKALQDYGSTRAAELSLPFYGDMRYEEGQYDKAVELYEEALEEFTEQESLKKLIWNNMAYAYEGKQDYEAAISCWQKIVGSQSPFLKGDAYFNMGRMYEAMEKDEEARKAYKRVVEDYAESVHFRVAKDKVERLAGEG
jgi:tetratricopeptide (TPR) repeat protein